VKRLIQYLKNCTLVEGLIIVLIVLVLAALGWMRWPKVDSVGAVNTLTRQGYVDIEITGRSFWGCSEDDVWRTKFSAISPSGHAVRGVVCEGILKGSTIRFDD